MDDITLCGDEVISLHHDATGLVVTVDLSEDLTEEQLADIAASATTVELPLQCGTVTGLVVSASASQIVVRVAADPFRDLIKLVVRIAEDSGKSPTELVEAFREYLELEAEIQETLGEE